MHIKRRWLHKDYRILRYVRGKILEEKNMAEVLFQQMPRPKLLDDAYRCSYPPPPANPAIPKDTMSQSQTNRPPEIGAKIAAKRAARLLTTPVSFQRLFKSVFAGKAARSARIKAFCAECAGFDRQAVTDCTSYACPLWAVRPFQVKPPKTKGTP